MEKTAIAYMLVLCQGLDAERDDAGGAAEAALGLDAVLLLVPGLPVLLPRQLQGLAVLVVLHGHLRDVDHGGARLRHARSSGIAGILNLNN